MLNRHLVLLFLLLFLAACRPAAGQPEPPQTPGPISATVSVTALPTLVAPTATAPALVDAKPTTLLLPTDEFPASAVPGEVPTLPPVEPTVTRPAPAPTQTPGDTAPLPGNGTPLRIEFPPGATSALTSGTLGPGQKQGYLFRAAAGQMASVQLSSSGDRASFVITGVEDDLFHKAPNDPAREWLGQLPLTQEYLITVAASGETSYTLELTIDPLPSDRPPPRPVLRTLVEAPVRAGPGLEFAAVHALPAGVSADVLGRTAGNEWLAISSPEPAHLPHVWIAATDVSVNGDLELLVPILEPEL